MKGPHSDRSEAGNNSTGGASDILAPFIPRLYVASMLERVRGQLMVIHCVHLLDPIAAEFGLPIFPLTYCEHLPRLVDDTDSRVAYRALVWGLEVARKELAPGSRLQVFTHLDTLLGPLTRGWSVPLGLKPYYDDVRYCERNFTEVTYRWVAAAHNPARDRAFAHFVTLKAGA